MSIIGAIGSGYSPNRSAAVGTSAVAGTKPILNPNASTAKAPGRVSSPAECKTCKNRKYQDGSDEMVSFKSAQHISPQSAPARVRGHEAEHVSNAYKDAAMNNGKVLQASVSLKTAVCPECGRTYVCGGETTTKIKYENESNPYEKERKAMHRQGLVGANIDLMG
ncbi:hypothetical protein SAMN02910451_01822 [Butyrivibrio hungatei]|uniref:Uncharacterized protein n=1 Tax=Butyrivibrio hungatei TaxID=185008 RepID=A0A1G5E6M7_9FIRM|nr:hypothetical protein [Butyrivibrio hungatei]SCY22673.1 hypothetical protein SAMN02910451_01822 [Butyrivibrio hungatei]